MKTRAVFRIRLLTFGMLCVGLLFMGRLYQIQIAHGEYYVEAAKKQYVHTASGLFERGAVFFSPKEGEPLPAASVHPGYLLAINPSVLADAEGAYEALNALVPIDRDAFMRRAADTNGRYREIRTRLSDKEAAAVKALDIEGVELYRDQWRHYPYGSLAAQTVGFVGYDDDNRFVGRYGLERYYEDTLARAAAAPSVNFFAEIFGNFGGFFAPEAAETREGDLVTSIEPAVSLALESELRAVHETLRSRITGGIIMDPHTGEIFALAAEPSFDLNDRSGITDVAAFRNPLVQDVYEFGSIIKALTMAAGLDADAVSPHSTYYDEGRLQVEDRVISNFDGVGRGTVSMQEVLNQSLNTGVAHVVRTMGRERFREYFKKLKLGTETGIDLPNETHGLIANLDSPREVEYVTASFGQGIALTPIAATRALASLANGGLLVTPHVVREVRYGNGKTQEVLHAAPARVFKEETSEEISRMLTNVVDDALRGGTVKLEHYSVAAKTGTAQIASPSGGYYDDRFLHSFFGYFPSYDPQFIIFLYTVEPQNVQYASETLTTPFMNLVQFLINYYNVPPDR